MSMPTAPRPDQQWILRSRQLLDQQAERLNPATLRSLRQARERALGKTRPRLRRGWALGLVAATAALLLSLSLRHTEPLPATVAPEPPAQIAATPMEQALTLPDTDLEMIVSDDDYAMLQDLEFYAWLQSTEHDG